MNWGTKVHKLYAKAAHFAQWGLPLKLLIGGIATILGGAGFLGYTSEYATYWYANQSGFRVPFEGVPYLSAAVILGSIFLLFSSAFVFAASIIFLKSVLFYLNTARRVGTWLEKLPYLSFLTKDVITVKINVRSWPPFWQWVLVSIGSYLFLLIAMLPNVAPHRLVHQTLPPSIPALTTYVYFFIVFAVMIRPRSAWFFAGAGVIVYVVVAVWLMFQPAYYAEFLRHLGYGGGIPITIETKDSKLQKYLGETETSLMLRTNEVLVLFDVKRNRFLEVPRAEVTYLRHPTGRVRRREWHLPRP